MRKNVIYQKFLELPGHPLYPYPPLVIEPDTDYICFTRISLLKSSYWKIIEVENYSDEEIKEIIAPYKQSYEIYCNQIIIGYLFQKKIEELEPLVVVPDLYMLPEVMFDKCDFTPTKDKDGNYLFKANPIYSDGLYNGRKFLLTIGVPVSNQIATIDRCLSHIKPLLEEIDSELLVVNTGSSDGTLEVCKAYGARIIDFPWCNDMSAVRNTGIYHALGEWYMSIDDDEWFEDVSEIIRFFKEEIYKEYSMAFYIQRNYRTLEGNDYYDAVAIRLGKITPELHFEGRIHDALVTSEEIKIYQLEAYAYHYGFAKGDIDKTKNKYKRNVFHLLYDIYEYPDCLRHNYQLSNEMEWISYNKEAYAYYLRGLSIEREKEDAGYAKKHAIHVINILYSIRNIGVFKIAKDFEKRYFFSDAERAYINLIQAQLKLQKNAAPYEILSYYQVYEYFKKQYEKHPKEEFYSSELGIECCTDKRRILNGKVIAFCAYCQLDEKEKALELFGQIEIDQIVNWKEYFCMYFLSASQEIYEVVWKRFLNYISNEWIEAILIGVLWVLINSERVSNPQERIAELLKCISFSMLEKKINRAWEKVVENLGEESLEVSFSLNLDKLTIQESFFYHYILKRKLSKINMGEERRYIFDIYIQLGSFIVTSYYSFNLLQEENSVIDSELLASYQIASAWKVLDDKKKALLYLKKAEKLCSTYIDDIEEIIKRNHLEEISPKEEMELLAGSLKQQIRKLIEVGKQKEAIEILKELINYMPEDKELKELWNLLK